MTTGDPYDALAGRLGFPGSTLLRSILQMLMTSDQARLAEALPGSVAEVAAKAGVPEEEVRRELDALYYKGIVFPSGDFNNRDYFRFARHIIQLHDSTLSSRDMDIERDRAFFQKWHDFCREEMYPRLAAMFRAVNARLSRVIPAHNAIKDLPDVLPCEDFHQISEGPAADRPRPLLLPHSHHRRRGAVRPHRRGRDLALPPVRPRR